MTLLRNYIDYFNNTNYLLLETNMKKSIDAKLGNLLNPTPAQEPTPVQAPATEKEKGNYKTVCYSIPPETAEKIRKIAAWDRKKINAVVTEAFEQYAAKWKPTVEEPPKF